MAVKNSTIVEKCWLEGSNDFQQRLVDPSGSYSQFVSELFQPYNGDLFNQFANMLVGLMGTYVESKLFENPLRDLKKPARTWGNTERGVAVKYLDAHSFESTDEALLKVEKPEYREWFYSVGKPRQYRFNWSKYELQRVFSEGDSYAFDDLLTATLTQMYSSDNYDEMNLMVQMFAEADNRMGGLYRHQLSAMPTNEATSKELLKAIRQHASMMKFPTMLYNHIDIPVHEDGSTLVLWVSADTATLANLDVEALSQVFQLDKADIKYRIIEIPSFPIPNVCAALTSEDFIYCRDVWYGVEPPFYNPQNMTYKYILNHSQLVGVNPVANCVLFTTDTNTAIQTLTVEPTALKFFDGNSEIQSGGAPIGGNVKLPALRLVGSVEDGNGNAVYDTRIGVKPSSAIFTIAAARPAEDPDDPATPIALNSRTYVDSDGVLHVQKSGVQADDVLTITATSTYINPSGATPSITPATLALTLADELAPTTGEFLDMHRHITYADTDETGIGYNGTPAVYDRVL